MDTPAFIYRCIRFFQMGMMLAASMSFEVLKLDRSGLVRRRNEVA
jgi:hypothetical protein